MIARYASAITTGTFVTFGLLFLMQLLIQLQPGAATEGRDRTYLSPFKPIIETPVHKREELPLVEDLIRTLLPPARPKMSTENGPVGVSYPAPTPPTGGPNLPSAGAFNDGPLVAMVRVAPVYPIRASVRGLEGFVIVQFDVMADGRVTNVVVVESTHGVFESPAIKAAERFKFKPRVVDGVALVTEGIQNLFRFNLEDQ